MNGTEGILSSFGMSTPAVKVVSIIYFLGFFLGSGLVSRNRYYYGFFNAAMKLPAGFTSGVVVAFYVSDHAIVRIQLGIF